MVEQLPFKEKVARSSRAEGTIYINMRKTAPLLIQKCRILRKKGFTLREISKLINIPFTTIYGHVNNVPFSLKLVENIKLKQIENTKRL